MKNTLAENMLRFGVKNLSESDLQRLKEDPNVPWNKNMGDPQWLNIPVMSGTGGKLTSGFADGVSYVQQFSHAAANVGLSGDNNVILLPKGTQWTLSPSKYFLLAKGMKVTSGNFGYGAEGNLTGLQDGMYIAKVAQGKGVGIDNKPVLTTPVEVAFTPGVGGIFVRNVDVPIALRWPNDNLFKTLQKLGHL